MDIFEGTPGPGRSPVGGHCTKSGTTRFVQRHAQGAVPEHFRQSRDGIRLSSIGLGTYLGEPDDATDLRYEAALKLALSLGCNVIDTAINYRFQRSERAIGMGLSAALAAGLISRDEVFVSTKGGFISFDGGWPMHPDEWINETFVSSGICQPGDFVKGHCMAPAYLRHQIGWSRRNLGLETIDLYYIHNPEGQLAAVGAPEFARRMRRVFEELEAAVDRAEIVAYGTATWNGYRRPPTASDHLSLEAMVKLAREVGGEGHHFRAVQLPVNMAMPEAFARPTQMWKYEMRSLLQAAMDQDITVFGSASLLQSKLASDLPDEVRLRLPGCDTDAQRALQFTRSLPGITTALVGMSSVEHVRENLVLTALPPLDPGAAAGVLR
ncbi:MAG: aldo/keto reductase [Acidobacteria bacterium]|nr:aldo/keto reductase [Acidobacteriota bacterium]